MLKKIARNLLLGAVLISCLSSVVIGISLYELQATLDNQKKIANVYRPALNSLLQMKTSLTDATEDAYAYTILHSPEEKIKFYLAIGTFDNLTKQYSQLEKHGIDNTQTLEQIKTLRNSIGQDAETIFATYERDGSIDVKAAKLLGESEDDITSKIDELINSERTKRHDLQDSLIANTASSIYTIEILSAIIIVSIMALGVLFSRRFTKSVEEKIQLERQLNEHNAKIKNERFTAIGEFSSKMAHDMRNPLNIIKTSLELLKINSKNMDEKTIRVIARIDAATSRISRQIEDVMDFVRNRPLQYKGCLLSEILKSAINGVDKPDSVIIETNSPDEIQIQCDAKMIESLFSNLITNAVQAVGDQGKITITIKEHEDHVVITVSDSGPGIPNEIMSRIFEPLFTTKQTGTGLGLASVKNIVDQHGGIISVRNNPTTFEIRLPKKAK